MSATSLTCELRLTRCLATFSNPSVVAVHELLVIADIYAALLTPGCTPTSDDLFRLLSHTALPYLAMPVLTLRRLLTGCRIGSGQQGPEAEQGGQEQATAPRAGARQGGGQDSAMPRRPRRQSGSAG